MKKVYLALATAAFFVASMVNVNAQSYCSSQASWSGDTYINNVTFNSINNTTTACATYENHTSQSTTVIPGVTYTMSVTSGDCDGGGAYSHGMEVWFDWNNDGDFIDPGENVHSKANGPASTETFTVTVPILAAGNTTRFRIVVEETGVSGSCGTYNWGETEDYTVNILQQPPYNIGINDVSATPSGFTLPAGYTEIPLNQVATVDFTATAINTGSDTISGAEVFARVLSNAYQDSALIDTLASLQDSTVGFAPFNVTSTGFYTFEANAVMDQTDTMAFDDTAQISFTIGDTVFARDDTSVTGGLGFNNGIGEFGHIFELQVQDTITSVSFYLNAPTVGAQARAIVYRSDTTQTNGYPYGASLNNFWEPHDSSRIYNITSSNAGWVHIPIGCNGAVLPAGAYLVALYQNNPNNMSLGFTYDLPSTTDVTFYRAGADTVWTDLKTSTSNVADAVFKVRANFGNAWNPNVLADSSFYCFGTSAVLKTNDEYQAYSWSTGTIFDSVTVKNPGVYSVTITDEISCTYEDSIQVVEYAQIGLTTSSNAASCGITNGDATATAAGSFPPFSYDWDNGMTGSTITNIGGNTYEVTVTDAVGCERVESVIVLGAIPDIAGSTTLPTCAGDADGTASVSVITGIPSYSYNWGTGGSADTETGLSAGTYSVTVSDSSGCFKSLSISVVDPDTLNVSTMNSTNPTSCGANNGVANASVTGGVAPYTYFWSNGQNQQNNINLSTGTYDVTVTDANGCVRTNTVTLIDPAAPTLTGVSATVTCSNDLGDVAVTVTGGTAPYIYAWSNGSSDSSQTGLGVGTYNVVVTDAQGCVRLATADVNGPDYLAVTFTESGVTGQGYADLTANPLGATSPYQGFQWFVDSGSVNYAVTGETNLTYAAAPNGLYWFMVTDANGCVDSAQYSLQVPTGLIQINQEEGISLYPNPATNQLNVQFDFNATDINVEIYDINGALVRSYGRVNGSLNEISIDVSGLANGMYMLGARSTEQSFFRKFQISR
jgi:hypothetical protein